MAKQEEIKYNLPDVTPPDWSIGDLYNQSWELIKKNKVLWIFGMAVATYAAGSSFNGLSNFSRLSGNNFTLPSASPAPSDSQKLSEVSSSLPQVLGTNTDALWSTISNLFSAVPTYIYFILGFEILLFVLLGWFISIIGSAWANGALLQAVQTGLAGKEISIRDSSEKSFASIKQLALLFFIPGTVLILATIAVFAILAALYVVSSAYPLAWVLIIIASLVILYFWIHLGMSTVWAQRQVVYEGKQWREALFAGYRISRKKKWAMLLLGIVNMIASGIVTLIPILVIAFFGILGFVSLNSFQALGIGLIGIAVIILVIFIFGSTLLGGITTAFKASVWTIAYNKIKGKYA